MPLFKTAEELMGVAQDRVLRGDFGTARTRYLEASRKFADQGNVPMANLASAYATLMGLGIPNPRRAEYGAVAQALAPFGGMPFKVGPVEVPASTLTQEARLLSEGCDLLDSPVETPAQWAALAPRFQNLSMAYRQLGNQNLSLTQVFGHGSVSASKMAPFMAAMAEEAMGQAVLLERPKEAAEHFENARNWWTQAGEPEKAQAAASRVGLYGKSAKCWFCGREVTGEGVQYIVRNAEMGPWTTSATGLGLPSVDPSRSAVYACKGCASTVDGIADERARQRAEEVEAKLEQEIAQLRREMEAIRMPR